MKPSRHVRWGDESSDGLEHLAYETGRVQFAIAMVPLP
jgi:hypothetical protein